jgi:hypothetical protein
MFAGVYKLANVIMGSTTGGSSAFPYDTGAVVASFTGKTHWELFDGVARVSYSMKKVSMF